MIFVDIKDRRLKFVKQNFEKIGENVLEYCEDNLNKISKKDILIFSPAKKFDKEELKKLPEEVIIFCGSISDEIDELLKNKQILYKNIMKNELFVVKNAILTAEGVLAIVLNETEFSLNDAKILILGNGRLAKAYGILFKKLNVSCTVMARNEIEIAQSFLYADGGMSLKKFEKEAKNFNVIINTIPAKFLDKEMVNSVNDETFFIETASVKCLDETDVKNFKYYFAPGLPGKFTCKTAGKIMFETIMEEFKNGT